MPNNQDVNYSDQLLLSLEGQISAWVTRTIGLHLSENADALSKRVKVLAEEAEMSILDELSNLLVLPFDKQKLNPMSILRNVYKYPTKLLMEFGIEVANRDKQQTKIYPDDVYDLVPSSFLDFGRQVHEAGIAWGAAKAYAHLSLRKSIEGNIE